MFWKSQAHSDKDCMNKLLTENIFGNFSSKLHCGNVGHMPYNRLVLILIDTNADYPWP